MKGFGWIKPVGRAVKKTVTAPLDAIASRAGAKAVDGAIKRVREEVTDQPEPTPPGRPIPARTGFWFGLANAVLRYLFIPRP